MKIAFILPGGGRSGGVRCTVVAANYLLQRNHSVRILYRRSSLKDKIKSCYFQLRYGGNQDWLDSFKGQRVAFDEINPAEFEPGEVCIATCTWSAQQLMRLSPANPKVHYIHGLTPWAPNQEKAAFSLAIYNIAVASYIVDAVKAYGGGEVLDVIPNGIDTQEYYPCGDEPARDGIGTIYGVAMPKDPRTVIKTFQQIKKEFPQTPRYLFGASPCPEGISCVDYKRYPSLAQARQIYSRCKVWIMASCSEGFGMPILEAMACGCAVVATDCGGPRDIIRDGENGFLVEVGNVDQIMERTERLLKDDVLRRRFVENSRQTVKTFTWGNTIDKLEKALSRIASK